MKNFIVILGMLIITLLWFLPAIIPHFMDQNPNNWGLIYIPITIFTVLYGLLIDKHLTYNK